jgi:NADH dehydrogenase/NADH:ubiquinone oxidoreductase subunit G
MRILNKTVYEYAKTLEQSNGEADLNDINQILTNSHIEDSTSIKALQPENRVAADEVLKSTLDTLYTDKDSVKKSIIKASFEKQKKLPTRSVKKKVKRKAKKLSKSNKNSKKKKKKDIKKDTNKKNLLFIFLIVLVTLLYIFQNNL